MHCTNAEEVGTTPEPWPSVQEKLGNGRGGETGMDVKGDIEVLHLFPEEIPFGLIIEQCGFPVSRGLKVIHEEAMEAQFFDRPSSLQGGGLGLVHAQCRKATEAMRAFAYLPGEIVVRPPREFPRGNRVRYSLRAGRRKRENHILDPILIHPLQTLFMNVKQVSRQVRGAGGRSVLVGLSSEARKAECFLEGNLGYHSGGTFFNAGDALVRVVDWGRLTGAARSVHLDYYIRRRGSVRIASPWQWTRAPH